MDRSVEREKTLPVATVAYTHPSIVHGLAHKFELTTEDAALP
jgi:hypothetical protein